MSQILTANLAALARWNHACAGILVSAPVPGDFAPVTGTDGTPTFARTNPDGAITWLGHTSMPRASATPLTHAFDPYQNGSNALGLSVGTGYEWLAFLPRLASHQMLFVLDSDVALARLALSLCDLTGMLADGKLVLLVADNPDALRTQLLNFLETHPGFDPPCVIHPLPTLAPDCRNGLITLAERLIREAITLRAEAVSQLASTLSERAQTATAPPDACDLLAFTRTSAHPYDRTLPTILSALAAKQPVHEVRIDQYPTASALLRLQTLAAHPPAAIYSDLFRCQLELPVRAEVPLCTVVPPTAPPIFWQPDRLPPAAAIGPRDRIVVHAAHHRTLLLAQNIPASHVILVPLAVTAPAAPVADTPRTQVALVGDLPSADPASLGLTLPSHVALWTAARDLILDAPFTTPAATASDLLRRAQTRAGVTITDPDLAASIQRLIRDILIPAAARVAVAKLLLDANLPLTLLGSNWHQPFLPPLPAVPPIPLTAPNPFATIACLIHFDPAGILHSAALHAPLHGVALIAPQHVTDALPATLPALLTRETEFLHPAPAQLVPTVKHALRDTAVRSALATAAARRLLTEHTWPQRLPMLAP